MRQNTCFGFFLSLSVIRTLSSFKIFPSVSFPVVTPQLSAPGYAPTCLFPGILPPVSSLVYPHLCQFSGIPPPDSSPVLNPNLSAPRYSPPVSSPVSALPNRQLPRLHFLSLLLLISPPLSPLPPPRPVSYSRSCIVSQYTGSSGSSSTFSTLLL